ncbi:MAG: hypothetical protein V1726_05095 [Methanobacteriota archaeon]
MDYRWRPVVVICVLLLCSSGCSVIQSSAEAGEGFLASDFDPLVDIVITVTVTGIRALGTIDVFSEPDFFIRVSVNGEVGTSPIWFDMNSVYDPWSFSVDVPDNVENVDVCIQLWDDTVVGSRLCDISGEPNSGESGYDVHLQYSIASGRWTGDDSYIGDLSGYGRLNGCDDGSLDGDERDCELWFMISQNDYDSDSLPFWVETQVYGTDPTLNNLGDDEDQDGVPIEWEHRWGFNPGIWEDQTQLDPDQDSLTNYEEYLTSGFGSDPFRKDVFLEFDFMEDSPDGVSSRVPDEAFELLKNPFHRRNIVVHVDTGEYEGGERIPFADDVSFDEAVALYHEYFLNNDDENWKRSVFHYGIIVYACTPKGYGFSGDVPAHIDYFPGTNAFIISSKQMEKNAKRPLSKSVAYFYGSAIMHELGHNFGLRWGHPFGVDAQSTKKPWRFGYWFYREYKSIMNYRYTYQIFDYSDGSHGKRDFNDWAALDFSHFEKPEEKKHIFLK